MTEAPRTNKDGLAWTSDVGPNRLVFGAGSLERLGELCVDLGAHRVLVVSDPGVTAAGHTERAVAALENRGLVAGVYTGVQENPSTRHIEPGVVAARKLDADLLVGLGGGSAMDTAKGINFVLTNGGNIADYQGFNHSSIPLLASIGVPTTAGTGSEAQSFALISDEATHRKLACGDRQARFGAVILDPELTSSTPRGVAAVSGMDALGHAAESYVSTAANPMSRLLAREAWRLLSRNFEASLADQPSIDVRGDMLFGAYLAGAAIEASMLGAAHATANPLSARFGVTHGAAVALMLPHVVRFNAGAAEPLYLELTLELERSDSSQGSGAERLAMELERLRSHAGLPSRLKDVGVTQQAIAELATEAAEQWTGRFNPRPLTPEALVALYEVAL